MLTVSDLTCSRGERRLIAGLDFQLQAGHWLQLSGANGVGKTTLLRTLVGLAPADSGSICWQGRPIAEQADHYRAQLLYLGHQAGVKDELTPLENLQTALALDGVAVDEQAARAALARLGLRGREHLNTRSLSAGQRRRVLMARLLLRPATLWVLDEPFTALDTAAVDLLCELLQAHVAGGGMALLTSHQPIPLAGGRELAL